MGGTTLVSFRSVPAAELNLKLRKHSGDADGSSSTLCFVHCTIIEAEVEFFFLHCLKFFLDIVIVHQLAIVVVPFPGCWEVLVVVIETAGTGCSV
jgi:hypothetical protein